MFPLCSKLALDSTSPRPKAHVLSVPMGLHLIWTLPGMPWPLCSAPASLVSWLCLEGATPSGHPSFAPDGLSLSRQSLSADAQWGDSQPIKSAPRSSVQSLQSIQLNPETGQSINSSHLLLRIVGGCSLWIILTVSVVGEGHRSYPHMEEGTRDP